MNAKKIIVPVLLIALSVSLMTGLSSAAQKAEQEEKVFIPKEVKADIQEGLASRQGRQDIPFTIFQSIYLPARENFHIVFFMNIKNSDLGYAPVAAAPAEMKAGQKGPQETPVQEAPAELEASFNVFLQFNRLDKNGVPEIFREAYVPTTIRVPAAEAEKEEVYSIGNPLPAGDYVVAIALTSIDLQKVGIAYHEFTLPDATKFSKTLETTPIFFVRQFDQMEAVEPRTVFHRGCFTYAILKVVPNLDRVFSTGENLDIFFFIFGAKPDSSQQYDIEIDFEVKKGEEMQIKFSPQTYTTPMISQPLPMKQTLKIKKGEEERIEQRDLPAGNYTLVITLLDKVSQNTMVKTVDFEVK
ncbi:MAG: hypothetical protein WAU81_13300 [Candidatus Aminicenantales bacterium]